MFSQIFILNSQGYPLLIKNYRYQIAQAAPQLFFQHISQPSSSFQPILRISNTNFACIQEGYLYVVSAFIQNISPSVVLESLKKIIGLLRDSLGGFSQQLIRDQILIVSQILDQFVDFGYMQESKEKEILSILSENMIFHKENNLKNSKQTGCQTLNSIKYLLSPQKQLCYDEDEDKCQLFVEEKITYIFNTEGSIKAKYLDGYISTKDHSNNNLSLNFNFNQTPKNSHFKFSLLHQSVNPNLLLSNSVVQIKNLPKGCLEIIRYRVQEQFQVPFTIRNQMKIKGKKFIELEFCIQSCYPENLRASFVSIEIQLPVKSQKIKLMLKNKQDKAEQQEQQILWTITGMNGGKTHHLKIELKTQTKYEHIYKFLRPLQLKFRIENYTSSKLRLQNLSVFSCCSKNIRSFVSYSTTQSSFICQI